jgi:hypothetical protein
MSSTFEEIKGRKCDGCGDSISPVYVDYMDCGGEGLILKADEPWVYLSPQMVADLVDALVKWQNSV